MLVKICDVARMADAEALDGLVEYIGFIVEPTSCRKEDLPQLRPYKEEASRTRGVVRRAVPRGEAVQHNMPPLWEKDEGVAKPPHEVCGLRLRG